MSAPANIELVSQGTGYAILIGFGALFALLIIAAVHIQKRYLMEDSDRSEMFMVANRTVGTGLTCSAVFSSWFWINESVYGAVYGYVFGIAAPVWFASGLSFQIALMAVLGISAKLRVPYAHTSLEFIRTRYGNMGHITFMVLNLINNVFGASSMVLTGAQLITGITGMHLVAATVLLPLGVIIYTTVGGLKATFYTDFLHTFIALTILIYITLAVLTNEHVGGIHGLYDKLRATEDQVYIEGNYKGSLLTFKSRGAALFGVVLKMCNLALVIMDTAFWQKSFASAPRSTVPGYDLASAAILAAPWGVGTVVGLTARAIEHTPIFVTYPNTMTDLQVNSGLVMPFVLKSLLGTGACVALLILTFMAITSTVSSSLIAVSSIISFDIYRTYLNTKATDRQILSVSHSGVIFYGTLIAGWTLMLNYAGANGTWILYFLPVVTCPGIFPVIFTLLWNRQTKAAAIISPILGLACGLGLWLGLSKKMFGAITIATTSEQMPSLYGALTSLFAPALFSIIISLLRPEKYDWRNFLRIELIGSTTTSSAASSHNVDAADEKSGRSEIVVLPHKSSSGYSTPPPPPPPAPEDDEPVHPFSEETMRECQRWLWVAAIFLLLNMSITIILWPLSLYRDYIFSKSFFTGWVTVAVFWQFFAFAAVVLYPLWDGRHAISMSVSGMRKDWVSRKNQ